MKSITEIIGGAQILLGISFDIQDTFEEYLTENHRAFLAMLRVMEEYHKSTAKITKGRGRNPYEDQPILRAFLAKSFFKIETVSSLLERLKSDSSLKKICGFTRVPSAPTFSRRMNDFSKKHVMEKIFYPMIRSYHSDKITGHISRDSTAIKAREKPVNRKKDASIIKPKQKRGRPGKENICIKPAKTKRLARQISQSSAKSLKELDKKCSWGCKKNSQGNISFWKGYKLHLDVTDFGIPVTAVVTGANVHDSQIAIPMEKLAERNITHLYSLMDSAYDAPEILKYINSRGRVAIVDHNKRRKDTRAPMEGAVKERYKTRTIVERSNSHLKDWLLPSKLTVKGYEKINFCLMSGVLCLAALKILQNFILPAFETAA